MRKEFVIGIILVLFLSGCSVDTPDNQESVEPDSSEYATDEQPDQPASESEETEEVADEPDTANTATMRFCESTKQTDFAKYEYYWTEDEYYEKVTTNNDGEVLKIATPDEVCVNFAGSPDGWQCSEGSDALFHETKSIVTELIGSPADVYGIVCEDVPYDEKTFDASEE